MFAFISTCEKSTLECSLSNVFLSFEIILESVLKHILTLTNQRLLMRIQQRVKTGHETRAREETRVAKNRCVAQETVGVIAKAV